MILVATVTPDQPFPSVSCMLQERLELKRLRQWILVRHVQALCMEW